MARLPKALVVDDLPVNRLILGTILHKLGFEVLEAENGLQCIDVYNQERAQLVCVFLDLQMPLADGYQATKGIRELESSAPGSGQARVPVVLCTASCLDDLVENGQTVAQRALALGADGAVRKPLTTFAPCGGVPAKCPQQLPRDGTQQQQCPGAQQQRRPAAVPMAQLHAARGCGAKPCREEREFGSGDGPKGGLDLEPPSKRPSLEGGGWGGAFPTSALLDSASREQR
ncbi:hypothetical protein GPECTOR_2g1175 [Gonium pectorale]|uniref:histidine kinase n=1 Tax=Gonium pectorale TaxID=33097 RepID=A0A150H0M5_GONPE|nr:hypothetical protein GPECTOR_2g1175 [Gonium pectorale]|eukprot:KXZ55625.1 hypothetical protein GPECTOR_2g1175 [Gonium pectorale]